VAKTLLQQELLVELLVFYYLSQIVLHYQPLEKKLENFFLTSALFPAGKADWDPGLLPPPCPEARSGLIVGARPASPKSNSGALPDFGRRNYHLDFLKKAPFHRSLQVSASPATPRAAG